MKVMNNYLQQIQEDNIQEVEPITVAAVGSVAVITNFIILLLGSSSLIKNTKVDLKLSKEINNIMKTGDKWIVHMFPEKTPNAFSLGFGRHIFITSKLVSLLTRDELIAVLLHEVYHSTKKHTFKYLMYKYPLFYLCAFLAITAGSMATGFMSAYFLAFLTFHIANSVGGIPYNIVVSKRMEYNADSFAVKQGYGKDLASALEKIKQWVKQITKNQKCGKVCQLVNKVDQAIDDHPEIQKRIERILKQSDKLYKVVKTNSYGKIKDFITKVWGK